MSNNIHIHIITGTVDPNGIFFSYIASVQGAVGDLNKDVLVTGLSLLTLAGIQSVIAQHAKEHYHEADGAITFDIGSVAVFY